MNEYAREIAKWYLNKYNLCKDIEMTLKDWPDWITKLESFFGTSIYYVEGKKQITGTNNGWNMGTDINFTVVF